MAAKGISTPGTVVPDPSDTGRYPWSDRDKQLKNSFSVNVLRGGLKDFVNEEEKKVDETHIDANRESIYGDGLEESKQHNKNKVSNEMQMFNKSPFSSPSSKDHCSPSRNPDPDMIKMETDPSIRNCNSQ